MAAALLVFVLIYIYHGVSAYNDMQIDPHDLPVSGKPYTLTWDNKLGSKVSVDLNEVTNPGTQIDTLAGVRLGGNITNNGYYKFEIPSDVRSDIQYEFKISNDENKQSVSRSTSFNITSAAGTGLPAMVIWTADNNVLFHISTTTPWPSDNTAALSTTTDDSDAAQTTANIVPPTSSDSSASSAVTAAASTGTLPAATSNPSPPSSSSNDLSSGAIAGVTIAVFLAGAGVSAFIFVFLRRRKRRRPLSHHHHQDQATETMLANQFSDKEVHHPHHHQSLNPSSSADGRSGSFGASPADDRGRPPWNNNNGSSFASPIGELAASSYPGHELDGSERSPVARGE